MCISKCVLRETKIERQKMCKYKAEPEKKNEIKTKKKTINKMSTNFIESQVSEKWSNVFVLCLFHSQPILLKASYIKTMWNHKQKRQLIN